MTHDDTPAHCRRNTLCGPYEGPDGGWKMWAEWVACLALVYGPWAIFLRREFKRKHGA